MNFKQKIQCAVNQANAKKNAKLSKYTVDFSIVDELVVKNLTEKPKNRICLQCDGLFLSTWVGRRICDRCKFYRIARAKLVSDV